MAFIRLTRRHGGCIIIGIRHIVRIWPLEPGGCRVSLKDCYEDVEESRTQIETALIVVSPE